MVRHLAAFPRPGDSDDAGRPIETGRHAPTGHTSPWREACRTRSPVCDPGEQVETLELHRYLRHVVALLPDRYRLVVEGTYLQGKPIKELARTLGVTEARISQMRAKALGMLREGIEVQHRRRFHPFPSEQRTA